MDFPRQTSGRQAQLRRGSVVIGIALLMLGIFGFLALVLRNHLSSFEISMAMFAAGLLQISHALAAWRRGWSIFAVAGALLYFGAAAAVLFMPFADERWIGFALAASLAAAGISRLVTAASLQHGLRGWEALSGVTTVAAAGIILAGIPTISLWPLAFIIVLDLIVEGAALANVGFALDGRPTKSRN